MILSIVPFYYMVLQNILSECPDGLIAAVKLYNVSDKNKNYNDMTKCQSDVAGIAFVLLSCGFETVSGLKAGRTCRRNPDI